MRTLLLYNPAAGRNRAPRTTQIRNICELFAARGHQPEARLTTAPGSAAAQAREALAEGFECILACGGDGTVHDVLQGLIDETRSDSAHRPVLGVIPLGTANALARHLRLPLSPMDAARKLLTFEPRAISVGVVKCMERRRYFTVMAGAGPDGALVYRMLAGSKLRLGRSAYYLRAALLFAWHRFPPFDLTWTEAGSALPGRARAAGTMAVRIGDLGGLFSRLAPQGNVHGPHMHLIVLQSPAWASLPAWFAASWLGLSRWNPFVEVANVTAFTCTPTPGLRIHVQADGEWIGTAPMHVHLIPNAVRLLMAPQNLKPPRASQPVPPNGADERRGVASSTP